MALTTATVTFDISDQLGNDFDSRRTKIWLTTNVPGDTVIDKAANKIRLGSGNVTLNADGTGSIVVWVPGADANPASWQTTIHVDYPDRNAANRGRGVKSFGPFTITANADLADLVAEMPVQPEYAAEVFERLDALEANSGISDALAVLAAQVNGYTMLGDVSGAITVQPVGTQAMNVTGPTTITIAGGHANGESFTLLIRSGGDDVTWANSIGFDAGDPEGDIISITFMKVEGYWTSLAGAGGGGEVVTPVTDPPTQPGTVTVDPTADGYNLSWVASTVAAGYEVQIDGGTWVDSGANLTHAFTGLASGSSHSGNVRAYNSVGAKSAARAWGPASVDTLGLHEQLLALDAPLYVRLSEGSLESFGSSPGTWTDNDSPAVAPPGYGLGAQIGDYGTTSTKFPNGVKTGLHRTNSEWAANQSEMTIIMLARGITGGCNFVVGGHVVASWDVGDVGNEASTANKEHLFVWRWKQSEGGGFLWRDGEQTMIPFTSYNAPVGTGDQAGLWVHRNQQFDAFTTEVDVAFILATPEALSGAQIMALAESAGTVGNPR